MSLAGVLEKSLALECKQPSVRGEQNGDAGSSPILGLDNILWPHPCLIAGYLII